MNPAQRQRFLVITAGAALALLVADRIIFTPLTQHWQHRRQEVAALQARLAEGRSLIARGDRLQSRWGEMQRTALPKDAAQAEQQVISAFDRWGRSAGVELGSIKPQWKKGGSDRSSLIECRVDATGSLATVARFLYEIERSSLPIRIETAELASRDESGQRVSVNLTVTGLRMTALEKTP